MTNLEQAVLRWISDHSSDSALQGQLAAAKEKRRDFVGTGVFLYLDVPRDCPSVSRDVAMSCPRIVSPHLPDGAGVSLFLKEGYLHYLELYSRSGFLPEKLDEFDLVLDNQGT